MGTWACISIYNKRLDVADTAWGGGFLLISWSAFFLSEASLQAFLVNACVSIWAIRLGVHIYQRNRHLEEDFRYQQMKAGWQNHQKLQIFCKVFLLQGLILYVVALPVLWINSASYKISFITIVGSLFLWIVGFVLETVADYQLVKFKKSTDHKGKILQTGLWSYSRHPNYLGEIIQWWAIWSITASYAIGWIWIVSPLLITYLIIKVSGVAPLERKMASHPDFKKYSEKTPVLAPLGLFNGVIYSVSWFAIISYGAQGSIVIPWVVGVISYLSQLWILFKSNKSFFLISLPLSIYILLFGFLQEMLLIHIPTISYPNGGIFPPFWILILYGLFALSFNSTLLFLHRKLFLAFLLGGSSALFFYYLGEKLGAVHLVNKIAYPMIFLSWGLFIAIVLVLNRKLKACADSYLSSNELMTPITVFFDGNCPICSREMRILKKRKQTGIISYISLVSEADLNKITTRITYKQAMEKIHAIDASGNIITGIDALSAVYAKTDLPLLAIFLQAPGFHLFFSFIYAIWCKIR
jgi:steroid 5-alpha reductase family enzyme/predicted DCC family thiol-disulfide oxidoreductase YuxK